MHVELVRDALRPEPGVEEVARVGVLRDEPQGPLLATAADHDRRAADRLGSVERALEGDRVALEGAVVVGEHPVRELEGVLEEGEPLAGRGVGDAEAAVLLLVPRRPDAEPGPAAREDVERRHGLEQEAGVAVGHPRHEGAELDPLGDRRRVGERRVALEHVQLGRADHRDLEEVVHDPQRGEPRCLGVAGDVAPRRARGGGGVGPGEPGDLQSELHARHPAHARPLCKACRGSGLQSRPTEGATCVTAPASGSHRRSSTRCDLDVVPPDDVDRLLHPVAGQPPGERDVREPPRVLAAGHEGAHVEHRPQGVVVDLDRPGEGDARPAEEQQPRQPHGEREERAQPSRGRLHHLVGQRGRGDDGDVDRVGRAPVVELRGQPGVVQRGPRAPHRGRPRLVGQELERVQRGCAVAQAVRGTGRCWRPC